MKHTQESNPEQLLHLAASPQPRHSARLAPFIQERFRQSRAELEDKTQRAFDFITAGIGERAQYPQIVDQSAVRTGDTLMILDGVEGFERFVLEITDLEVDPSVTAPNGLADIVLSTKKYEPHTYHAGRRGMLRACDTEYPVMQGTQVGLRPLTQDGSNQGDDFSYLNACLIAFAGMDQSSGEKSPEAHFERTGHYPIGF